MIYLFGPAEQRTYSTRRNCDVLNSARYTHNIRRGWGGGYSERYRKSNWPVDLNWNVTRDERRPEQRPGRVFRGWWRRCGGEWRWRWRWGWWRAAGRQRGKGMIYSPGPLQWAFAGYGNNLTFNSEARVTPTPNNPLCPPAPDRTLNHLVSCCTVHVPNDRQTYYYYMTVAKRWHLRTGAIIIIELRYTNLWTGWTAVKEKSRGTILSETRYWARENKTECLAFTFICCPISK